MKKALGIIVASALVSPLAFADNPNANQRGTMTQALASVAKANNPAAPGHAKAGERLVENQAKHRENDHAGNGHAAEHGARVERVERAERPERPERAERVSRADAPGRAADRPQPPGRALGRPDLPPGRARGH